jgi:uncharacterized membrane protein
MERDMSPSSRFLIRLVLAVVCSYFVVKIFFPAAGWLGVLGFTVFFLGLVYLIELQRRRSAEKRESEKAMQ